MSLLAGDIHQNYNVDSARPSVTMHLYGAPLDLVETEIFDTTTGTSRKCLEHDQME